MAAYTSALMAFLPPSLPRRPTPPPSRTLLIFSHHNISFTTRPRSAAFIRFRTDVPRCSFDEQPSTSGDSTSSFCIIEGPETVDEFVQMQLHEIDDNIKSRRNKIFLLMEEVRRLRIQQCLKIAQYSDEGCEDNELPDIPSTIPFLSHTTPKTLRQIYMTSFSFAFGIIVFGGLLAPIALLFVVAAGAKLRTRWYFLRVLHTKLAFAFSTKVDPIVASFSGGTVGVISALMVLETNNVLLQEKKRCKYCYGSGYLACARCSARGLFGPNSIPDGCNDSLQLSTTKRCPNCSGTGKVMCPSCLCTGMAMTSEHDPRIDPFD